MDLIISEDIRIKRVSTEEQIRGHHFALDLQENT